MATSVTVHQLREATGGYYRSTSTVTLVSGGIPEELFVFAYSDDSYQHVATLSDLTDYPATKTPGDDYYRLNEVVLDLLDVSQAEESASLVLLRVQQLVDAYEDAKNTFFGEEDNVITNT